MLMHVWEWAAVRQHGGRVRKCLTILFNFLSSFVSLITVYARSYA